MLKIVDRFSIRSDKFTITDPCMMEKSSAFKSQKTFSVPTLFKNKWFIPPVPGATQAVHNRHNPERNSGKNRHGPGASPAGIQSCSVWDDDTMRSTNVAPWNGIFGWMLPVEEPWRSGKAVVPIACPALSWRMREKMEGVHWPRWSLFCPDRSTPISGLIKRDASSKYPNRVSRRTPDSVP